MTVSVLILTLDEEQNLPDCLESVAWSDDVVVFDSFSSDRTCALAEERGVRVIRRHFDNYADHRNAALHEIDFRNEWVLMVDADERVPGDLAEEVKRVCASATPNTAMYLVRRKDFFLGRWLRRSSGYPTWFGRLVRPNRVQVRRAVNEEYHADGRVDRLVCHLHHYPFSKGVDWWVTRQNRYSAMEAAIPQGDREAFRNVLRFLVSRDSVKRRRALKCLAHRLPCTPLVAFIYLYFWRGGFLEGRPGLYYCVLRVMYEFLIELKRMEIGRRHLGLPI